MNKQNKNSSIVTKPPMHFDEPRDVIAEESLSKVQKTKALERLEQDARQVAEASSEGMAGGERNKLHEVLIAKDKLDLSKSETATTNKA